MLPLLPNIQLKIISMNKKKQLLFVFQFKNLIYVQKIFFLFLK